MTDTPHPRDGTTAGAQDKSDPNTLDGFDLAREWFEQWAPSLHEIPWSPEVPHEGLFQLGAMINRATAEAYKRGADRERDLHRKIYGDPDPAQQDEKPQG